MVNYTFNISIDNGDQPNRLFVTTLVNVFDFTSEEINNRDLIAFKKSNIEGYSYMVKLIKNKLGIEYHIHVDDLWQQNTAIDGKSYFTILQKGKEYERDEFEHVYKVDFKILTTFKVEAKNDGNGKYWYECRFHDSKRIR